MFVNLITIILMYNKILPNNYFHNHKQKFYMILKQISFHKKTLKNV